jgi:hypothetical protein
MGVPAGWLAFGSSRMSATRLFPPNRSAQKHRWQGGSKPGITLPPHTSEWGDLSISAHRALPFRTQARYNRCACWGRRDCRTPTDRAIRGESSCVCERLRTEVDMLFCSLRWDVWHSRRVAQVMLVTLVTLVISAPLLITLHQQSRTPSSALSSLRRPPPFPLQPHRSPVQCTPPRGLRTMRRSRRLPAP